MPTNSALVDDALSFLSKIEFIGNTTSINQNSQTKNPPIQLVLDDILRSGVASPSGTCPIGETYNGEEALESTILLHMPFTAGESWVVGGGGSFYGNGLHCNSNNDYYATDWNKPSGGDAGAWVLAVADGIVSDIVSTSCPVTGYGCYIQIDHDDGFRTVYAHLMEGYVYGTVDGAVRAGASIGRVGRTGTDNDHLHLRFLHDSGGYHSYCYNDGQTCPNGENPRSPQGYIPSPMDTSDGSTILVDGTIYKSVNGQTFVTDLRNKDGWVTTIYIRNSDISVRTVRIYYKRPNGSATPKDYDECTLAVGQWCWIPVNVYDRVESGTIASAYIEGGNELDVVTMHRKSNELDADNGFYMTGLGDPAFEQAALDLYAPALYQNIWGWNPSKIYIMNTGESANTVSLLFKGRSGYQNYSGELEIAAKGFAEILTTQFVWSYPWTGSLVISNSSLSTRYPLVAQVVNTSSTDGKSYTYNASVAGNNLLYVPDAYKNNWTLTTGITIQNLDSYTADVDIFFYDRSGNLVTSYPLGNIAPLSCSGIQLSNITNLPDGFAGTAIVDGDGAILTGLVRGDRPGSGHYGHSITGLMSSYLIFPYMRRQTGGENSSILIQNAWSQGTTIELNYYSASGGYIGTRAYQMNARGATGVYLGNESWLGANWEGIVTAQVISYPRTTIVGVARNDLSNAISSYNGNVR